MRDASAEVPGGAAAQERTVSEAPSWSWRPDRRSRAAPETGGDLQMAGGRPPATMLAGVSGMAVLITAEVAPAVGRDDLTDALPIALVGLLATQVVLPWLGLRSAPAVAVAVVALLGRPLRWFPGYEL